MPRVALLLLLLVAACSGPDPGAAAVDDLPETTAEAFVSRLEATDRPVVVNVWASWCLPCRSEAPLLAAAYEEYSDRIEFIGVDVQDTQAAAKEFLAEFDLPFDHVFDRDRSIPNHFAAIGTPITFFFGPGGELIDTHRGVIDDRGLALGIDELLRLES